MAAVPLKFWHLKFGIKIKPSKRECLDGFIFSEKKRHLRHFSVQSRLKKTDWQQAERFFVFRHNIYGVKFDNSIRFQISNFRFQISGFKFQTMDYHLIAP